MRGWTRTAALVVPFFLVSIACQDEARVTEPPLPEPPGPAAPPVLTSAEDGCFHWPQVDFSPKNFAETEISFQPGDTAADFTLRDLDGDEYTLSKLLVTKPVLLVLGSFT